MTRLVRAALFWIGTLFALMIPLLLVLPAHAAPTGNGILSPASETAVNGIVNVHGVAQHPGFRKWQLDLLIDGDHAQTRFIAVSEEMKSEPAALTALDTTRYPDGNHTLRLRVVYTGLQYDEFYTQIIIDNDGILADAIENGDATNAAEELPAEEESQLEQPGVPEVIHVTDGVLGAGAPEGARRVEIDISDQTLTAWQGETVVLKTSVSTGKPGWRTLPGTFNVYVKYNQTRMRGPGYDTPDVPWTMYYYQGFAIHGAYWHNDFGTPVSHGCVNLRVDEAKLLFDWAEVGLEVVVND